MYGNIILKTLISGIILISCSSTSRNANSGLQAAVPEPVEGLELPKFQPDELLQQADYHFRTQKFDESLYLVQKVIIHFPKTVYSDQAYFIKGNVYLNILNHKRDLKKASAAYRMVMASSPATEFDRKAKIELDKINKK